jgi:pantoate--beta-alanine ligase
MNIITQKNTLKTQLSPYYSTGKSIGFVPTMGALHQGHLALVKQSLKENHCTVVSIFVNPTQFDNPTDLEKYPRTLQDDVKLLKSVSDSIIVFSPEAKDFYGGAIQSKKYNFSGLESKMEGKHRSGHFDGVGTVVSLLFKAINPTVAYFGEKDFQQLLIIKKLVQLEKLAIIIKGHPIVREPDGLAMSSRNKRLTPQQRKAAPFIYKTLKEVKDNYKTQSFSQLRKLVIDRFKEHPLLQLEYFEIANEKNLDAAYRKRKGNTYRAFIAVYAGEIRLIDNIALN